MKKLLMKLSILCLSVFTVSAGATAATIPLMMESFSSISPTTIELLMTIPSLGIILFTPLSNFVADKIGIKNTILTGLFLILISGIIPALTMNFPLIFISRIFIGLGTGLIASFSQSLIIQLFEGTEQQRMLGLSSVFQGLGMFAITYAVGILIGSGWQAPYFVYLIALPILLLAAFYIPNLSKNQADQHAPQAPFAQTSKKIDGKIWILALFAFLFNTTFAFIPTKFATLVMTEGYGTLSDASTLLGIMSFAMAAGGFLFMVIQKRWHRYSMAIGLAFAAISYAMLSFSHSLFLSGVAVVLVGMSVSIFMASMITLISSFTSMRQVAFSTSVAITCANVGTLISPYVTEMFANVFHNQSATFTYFVGMIIFAILFVVATIAGMNFEKIRYHEPQGNLLDEVHTNVK
ncbi:MFS transporter [Listeria costaricensis]|uniref:MFS transporter n=1 Tax=Listeria costaricensis TaxID=2026604 RepID=UPI000C07AC95|nr:MFS transporter [Listeria costaricensis]